MTSWFKMSLELWIILEKDWVNLLWRGLSDLVQKPVLDNLDLTRYYAG